MLTIKLLRRYNKLVTSLSNYWHFQPEKVENE